MMPGVRLLPLAALLLLHHQCGAFVGPSALGGRVSARGGQLELLRASSKQQVPRMVLSGLPRPDTAETSLDPMNFDAWINDNLLPTTLGRAAFSSVKDKAREMMVKGVEKRGVDWTGVVERLQVSVWRGAESIRAHGSLLPWIHGRILIFRRSS